MQHQQSTDLRTLRKPNEKRPHQVQHAAQHGQQEEGCLSAHIVDGAHHRGTGGWNPKDERPDGVQIKLHRHRKHVASLDLFNADVG